MEPQASPASIGLWVLAAIAVLQLLNMVFALTGRAAPRKIEPDPLRVREDKDFAAADHAHPNLVSSADCRAEHAKDRTALAHAVSDIRDMFDQHAKEAEARASKIHSRIDPIAQEVTAVKARLNDHLEDHRAKRI
jgi:hypothetical protein